MARVPSWLTVAGAALPASACSGDDVCDQCTSLALLSIHPLEGPWVAGAYQLTLQVDDRTYQCAIGIPDNFWERGSQLNVDCAPKLELDLGPSSSCTYTGSTPAAISGACMTSNQGFLLQSDIVGTPARLVVHLQRNDTVLIDQTIAPRYGIDPTSSSECDPLCLRSNIALTFPRITQP